MGNRAVITSNLHPEAPSTSGGQTPSRKRHHRIAVRADRSDPEDPVAVSGVGLDVNRERRQVGEQSPRDEGRPRFKRLGHGAAVDGGDGWAGSTGCESVFGPVTNRSQGQSNRQTPR